MDAKVAFWGGNGVHEDISPTAGLANARRDGGVVLQLNMQGAWWNPKDRGDEAFNHAKYGTGRFETDDLESTRSLGVETRRAF